jgi:hypothetical protein
MLSIGKMPSGKIICLVAQRGMPKRIDADDDRPQLSGNRKLVRETPCVRFGYPWPTALPKRLDVFRDWKFMALQIIHHEGGGFRLLSAMDEVLTWETGEIWASDQEISVEAGCCEKKTISREVAMFKRLGLLDVDLGWRDRFGKLVRTRKMRLALPEHLPAYVHVRFR